MVPRPLSSDKAAMWSVLFLAIFVQLGFGSLVQTISAHFRFAPLWSIMGLLAILTVIAAYRSPNPALNDAFAWHGVGVGWIAFAAGAAGLAAALVRVQFPHLPVRPETLIMATTIGPILEELLYRGFLWYVVADLVKGNVGKPAAAAFVTATLCATVFALLHSNPSISYFWLRFTAGLLNGFLRHRSGSSLTPAAAHLSFNVMLVS